jgi:hypothetical protein
MTLKVDKREDGLRELAAMIAAAYRQGMTRESRTESAANIVQEDSCRKTSIAVLVKMQDPECDGLYTETVKVDNFLRNLKSRERKSSMRKIKTT